MRMVGVKCMCAYLVAGRLLCSSMGSHLQSFRRDCNIPVPHCHYAGIMVSV
jgi:hypothetical protein